MPAKVLFLDLETAPNLGWTWGKYDQNVIDFERMWFLLSFAYKWMGEDDISVRALPDFRGYARDRNDDGNLVRELHRLVDEADIIVAQNGDQFDIKRANTRFIAHNLPPPSSYKTIDTLKYARKSFAFQSNKLSDLGKFLGCGVKLPHTGFQLWAQCMDGDLAAWEVMKEYNKQDVALLEQVYYKLRPWATTHPNLALYDGKHDQENCPVCRSDKVQKRGFNYTKMYLRQRWNCKDCGTWYSGALIKKDKG